jgi:hypothetical protein
VSENMLPEQDTMTNIVMVLAAGPGQPQGDVQDRVTLHVGLTGPGYLDLVAWATTPHTWTFTRTSRRGTTAGTVMREHESWALCGKGDDSPIWFFAPRNLRPGEHATLRHPDGNALVYRIVSVTPD